MRIWIRYGAGGRISSVLKALHLDASVTAPFGPLGPDEGALEVAATPELEALDAHEYEARFTVDAANRTLVPFGGEPPRPPATPVPPKRGPKKGAS